MPVFWGKGGLKPSVGSSGGRSTPQQNLETLQPTAQKPTRLPCGGKPQQKGLNCAGFSPTLTVVHRAPWDQLSRVGVCTDGPFLSDTSHPSVQGELFRLSVLLPACGFSGREGGF